MDEPIIPQIPESFIKYFVKKQGEVGDVGIEHIRSCIGQEFKGTNLKDIWLHELKLTENNEISIYLPTPIKQIVDHAMDVTKDEVISPKVVREGKVQEGKGSSYSKEDVMWLMQTSFYAGMSCEQFNFDISDQMERLFKENL